MINNNHFKVLLAAHILFYSKLLKVFFVRNFDCPRFFKLTNPKLKETFTQVFLQIICFSCEGINSLNGAEEILGEQKEHKS